jgi:photosystem II stability/assembly factor-like uncharacterized protein
VTVTTPPRRSEIEQDRDLAQRVAALEALIEEARQRARRRRIRNGTALAVAAAAGVGGLIGFHGGGGGSAGTAALSGASGARGQSGRSAPSLAPIPAGNGAQAFAFDPRRPNVVFMAVAHAVGGVYVFKTTDGGEHWRSTGAQGTGWVSDILSLTPDPTHPGTLYAGTDTAVYKTVDSGRTWQPFNQGLFPPNGGRRVCYPAAGGRRYCVKQWYGTPGTPHFNRGNGYVLDVAVDPIHSNVVYSAAGAIRKSTDAGRTWHTVLLPALGRQFSFVTRIAIAPTRPESIYAIAYVQAVGGRTAIYKSTDAGTTWQATGSGSSLPPSCCGDSMDALVVDPSNPQTLYAAVGQTVLATTDGGATWESVANGLPSNAVTSLAADPRRPGTLYASVDIFHAIKTKAGDVVKPTGGIYATTDGGQTWSEVFAGFGVDKVAVDPARPSTIYAAGWAGRDPTHANKFRLFRSTDGAHTWTIAG